MKVGINHSYLIASGEEKYVLRVYSLNWKTEEEIREELWLLDYLKENGLLVSHPIRNGQDEHILRVQGIEGERMAVLFSYAEGENIKSPSEKVCFHLGQSMAKMHALTLDKSIKRKDYHAASLISWAYDLAKNYFPEPSYEMDYFERANAEITTQFEQAKMGELRHGIVHLDLWHDNMKVLNESELTFFDFDNCGNGPFFLDMAYSLMILFKTESDKVRFEQKRNAFYEGYESISAISHEEKRLIPYGGLAIWLHYTGVHIQRFDDFSNQFFSAEFLKFWIHTVDQWMKYNGVEI